MPRDNGIYRLDLFYITRNTVYLLKYVFYFPKEILYLIINDCIVPIFIIIFFEKDKFNKITKSFKGLLYGLLNIY